MGTMCGIVGYAGKGTACSKPLEVCLQGLKRLEYRGYDSAGVALVAPGMERVAFRKKEGRLDNLVEDIDRRPMPDATVGIGHTRWATNGAPSDVNSHPHISQDGHIALIHNGIIENAPQLKFELQAEGYRFVSSTDTEVAAKLLGKVDRCFNQLLAGTLAARTAINDHIFYPGAQTGGNRESGQCQHPGDLTGSHIARCLIGAIDKQIHTWLRNKVADSAFLHRR